MLQSERPTRSIRLPREEVDRIIEKIVQSSERNPNVDKRQAKRHTVSLSNVQVNITQPSAAAVPYIVDVYSISAGGMGFLHGGYVHGDSVCQVRLPTTDNAWVDLRGVVVRCRYVERGIHDVGLKWVGLTEPLDISQFLAGSSMALRVLVVEDEMLTAKLVTRYLERNRISPSVTGTLKLAREKLSSGQWDVVFLDLELPDGRGFDLLPEIREQHAGTSVVAFTAANESERAALLDKGFDDVIIKPFSQDDIARIVSENSTEPVTSSLADNRDVEDLLKSFVLGLPAELEKVAVALRAGQTSEVLPMVRKVRSSAASYGFGLLAEAAVSLEEAISTAPENTGQLMRSLQKLVRMSQRLVT